MLRMSEQPCVWSMVVITWYVVDAVKQQQDGFSIPFHHHLSFPKLHA